MQFVKATDKTPDHYKSTEILHLRIISETGLKIPWTGTYDKEEDAFYPDNLNPISRKEFNKIEWLDESAKEGQQEDKTEILTNVLSDIVNWKLPDTGEFWDEEKTRPISYEANYGNNGVREYIRSIAREALNKFTQQ